MQHRHRHTEVILSQVCFVAALALTPAAAQVPDLDPTDSDAAVAMRRFLERQAVAREYSAARRLEASGSGQRGWLDALTEFTPASGLVYTVTGEGGSGIIRRRVLRSLLEEEQRLIASGASGRVALTTENYDFTAVGVEEGDLAVVEMRPRRRERSLIHGRMLLSLDGALVRIEGRLAKNPSFWTTRVDVVRTYGRINGAVMPLSLESTAQLRFFGRSSLRMTYRYSQVDGEPVAAAALNRHDRDTGAP